jgi:hypothetical protein
LDETVKTYIEEFLATFSGFHQTVFSFLTAYSLQQLFPQLSAHSNFFHSHSPTKQTLRRPQFPLAVGIIKPSVKIIFRNVKLILKTKFI